MTSTLGPSSPGSTAPEDPLMACCSSLAVTQLGWGVPESGESSLDVSRAVQVAVLCVLSLTVLFGIFFLGCNLLIKSESMIDLLARRERRSSMETEVVIIGA